MACRASYDGRSEFLIKLQRRRVKLASNALCAVIDMETKMYSPKRISINEVSANYYSLSRATQLSRNKRAVHVYISIYIYVYTHTRRLPVIASLNAGAASKRKHARHII